MISKAELEELYREDDRLRAEHRAWMAQRAPSASPPVRETDDAGIIYRTVDNNAMAAVAEPETDETRTKDWERWLHGHLDIFRNGFREEMIDSVAEGMRLYVAERLDQERVAFERKLSELRCENAELKGMIGTVLRLFAGETKAADIVDIRRRHGSAA